MIKRILKKNKLWISLIVILVLAIAVPLPYYIELPGKAVPVQNYVRVKNKANKKQGTLRLVYVSLLHARPATFLWSYTNPFTSRIPASEITGNNTDKDYNLIQSYYMQDALNQAKYVALKEAHYPVERKFQGIYVMSILNNSSFEHKLRVGNVVTKVNGKSYQSSSQFRRVIAKKKVGTSVKITYLRGNQTKTVSGKLIKLPQTNRAGLGITLADKSYVKTPVKIKTNLAEIGGPSAGLMMSLELYKQLSHNDFLHGRNVAGTGTIAADGSVGEIGGVDKKIIASDRAHAQIFLVPVANYAEAKRTAKKIKTKMKIIPVTTFKQAVTYLKKTNK